MMSVSFFMAYRSFWKFWQASTPATIRRLLKPRHPDSRIARVNLMLKAFTFDALRRRALRRRPRQLSSEIVRQLLDLSTTIWVNPSFTGETCHRGALNYPGERVLE